LTWLKCVWQIIGVHCQQHITNSEILSHAGVGPLATQIARRRRTVIFHIARQRSSGGAENAGVDNAVVENAGDDGWRAISIENYKIPVV